MCQKGTRSVTIVHLQGCNVQEVTMMTQSHLRKTFCKNLFEMKMITIELIMLMILHFSTWLKV